MKLSYDGTVLLIVGGDFDVDLSREIINTKINYIRSNYYHHEDSKITVVDVKLREAYTEVADFVIDLCVRKDNMSTCTGSIMMQTEIIDKTTAKENSFMGKEIYSYCKSSNHLYDNRYESLYFQTRITIGLASMGVNVSLVNQNRYQLLEKLSVLHSNELANFCTSLPLGIRVSVFLYRWIHEFGYPCYPGIVIASFIDSYMPYFALPKSQQDVSYNTILCIEERKHQRYRTNNDIDTI